MAAPVPRRFSFLFPRLRSAGAAWRGMLRDKEIRIVSGPPGEPYAITIVQLSGQVIVQLEKRFWLETPGPLREAAIRAHVELVREEFRAIGSPAALVGAAVFAVRVLVSLGSGGLALSQWMASGSLPILRIGLLGFLAAAAWLVPRGWITRIIQPLIGIGLRHLIRTFGAWEGTSGGRDAAGSGS